jgi:DNA-directed RNA polymerase specialized sigma24 family protein
LSTKAGHSKAFIDAILSNDTKALEGYINEMLPRLMEYLQVTVKANHFHAEECAQHAFASVLERISRGNFDEDMNVLAYLLVSARNEYFAIIKRENRDGSAVFHEMFFTDTEEQMVLLADEDRELVLKKCLQQLSSESRDFMIFLIRNPEISFIRVAKIFNISPINARTKKSRLVSKLSDCYKRNSEK